VIAIAALIEELNPSGDAAIEASLKLLANLCLKCPQTYPNSRTLTVREAETG
jgi:hypothetical protein